MIKQLLKLSFIALFFLIPSVYAQDFKSLQSLEGILELSPLQLEDTLIKKGFTFERSVGLTFKYKKANSTFDFKTMPKELTYTFTDRSLFLKLNSELVSNQYNAIKLIDTVLYNNKNYQAVKFNKKNTNAYIWSIDDASKSTMYVLRLIQNEVLSNSNPVISTQKKEEAPANNQVNNQIYQSPNPYSVYKRAGNMNKSQMKAMADSAKKQDERKRIAWNQTHVLPTKIIMTFSLFSFKPGGSYPSSTNFAIHFETRKSTLYKVKKVKSFMKDAGTSSTFSWFQNVRLGEKSSNDYINMQKIYYAYNAYNTINLKFADLDLAYGFALNYNIAHSPGVTVGFLTSGLHFSEALNIKYGPKTAGRRQNFIGFRFDQYYCIKGKFIGCFGLSIGL